MAFVAESRIPTRPLSYEYIDQAINKELIVDYNTGEIYVKDTNGNIHNITYKVIEQVTENIEKDPDIIGGITITITDPNAGDEPVEVAITDAIVNNYLKIVELDGKVVDLENKTTGLEEKNAEITENLSSLQENITKNETAVGEIKTALENVNSKFEEVDENITKIENVLETDEEGNISIPVDRVQIDDTHQFVTSEQLINIERIPYKAEISYLKVTIPSIKWVGNDGDPPYSVTLDIPEITEDTRPTIDLVCSSYYETSQKEEDAFCVYKGVTGNGTMTLYNRVLPEIDLTIQIEIKTPINVLN